jgi:hypothetical protein
MELEPDGTEAEDSDPAEDGGDEEDDGISEPALGSIEDHPNGYLDASDWNGRGRCQENWASGNRDDLEGDEHDGAEPEEDSEPSLGAFEGMTIIPSLGPPTRCRAISTTNSILRKPGSATLRDCSSKLVRRTGSKGRWLDENASRTNQRSQTHPRSDGGRLHRGL